MSRFHTTAHQNGWPNPQNALSNTQIGVCKARSRRRRRGLRLLPAALLPCPQVADAISPAAEAQPPPAGPSAPASGAALDAVEAELWTRMAATQDLPPAPPPQPEGAAQVPAGNVAPTPPERRSPPRVPKWSNGTVLQDNEDHFLEEAPAAPKAAHEVAAAVTAPAAVAAPEGASEAAAAGSERKTEVAAPEEVAEAVVAPEAQHQVPQELLLLRQLLQEQPPVAAAPAAPEAAPQAEAAAEKAMQAPVPPPKAAAPVAAAEAAARRSSPRAAHLMSGLTSAFSDGLYVPPGSPEWDIDGAAEHRMKVAGGPLIRNAGAGRDGGRDAKVPMRPEPLKAADVQPQGFSPSVAHSISHSSPSMDGFEDQLFAEVRLAGPLNPLQTP